MFIRLLSLFILLILFPSCALFQKDISLQAIRQIPEKEKKQVLFVDFENNSDGDKTEWDGLRRAIPSMIMTDFKNFGAFKPVPDRQRAKAVQKLLSSKKINSEEELIKAGVSVNADYVLAGSFKESSGDISISAKIYNTETKKLEFSKEIKGPTAETLNPPKKSVIKQSAFGLLSQMKFDLKNNEFEILAGNIETTNLNAALKNYKGEIELERADHLKSEKGSSDEIQKLEDNAKSNFNDALENDPKYINARRNLGKTISLLPPIF